MSSHQRRIQEIESFGIRREINPATGRKAWAVTCECGVTEYHNWKATMPPEALNKFIQQQGWQLDLREPPKCPACIQKRRKAKRGVEEMAQTITCEAPEPQPAAEPAPEPAAQGVTEIAINPKLLRSVYSKLEEAFDEEARRYVRGWSDDRVARETGASLDFVQKIRREAYGPIEPDPAVIEIKAKIGDLQKSLKQVEDFILNETQRRLEPIQFQLAKAMEALAALEAADAR